MLSVVSAPKKGTGGETLEGHSLVDLDESSDDEPVVGFPETS